MILITAIAVLLGMAALVYAASLSSRIEELEYKVHCITSNQNTGTESEDEEADSILDYGKVLTEAINNLVSVMSYFDGSLCFSDLAETLGRVQSLLSEGHSISQEKAETFHLSTYISYLESLYRYMDYLSDEEETEELGSLGGTVNRVVELHTTLAKELRSTLELNILR